jgi:cytochrome c
MLLTGHMSYVPMSVRCSSAMVAASVAAFLLVAAAAQAQIPPIDRGRALAQANCAGCHAIGRTGESPLPKAPPFRILHRRYPVQNLAEALAEGIRVVHPMPEFRLKPNQIDDLIAYLKSLES